MWGWLLSCAQIAVVKNLIRPFSESRRKRVLKLALRTGEGIGLQTWEFGRSDRKQPRSSTAAYGANANH